MNTPAISPSRISPINPNRESDGSTCRFVNLSPRFAHEVSTLKGKYLYTISTALTAPPISAAYPFSCLPITSERHLWGEPHRQETAFRKSKDLSISFWNEQSPAPKIVKRSNNHTSGKYPCLKAARMLQWKTRRVLCLMRLLDCDPSVSMLYEQPCEIEYSFRGVAHLHRPDLFVEVDTRKELWDVIPTRMALELAPRTALLASTLAGLGYIYQAVPESEVAKQPRLNNVQLLLQFGRRPPSILERETVRRILRRDGYVTWGDAYQEKYGPNGRETLCHLVLKGALAFDLGQRITATTRFLPHDRGN
jgi:hypothetical protein